METFRTIGRFRRAEAPISLPTVEVSRPDLAINFRCRPAGGNGAHRAQEVEWTQVE
jgi:hypothetical protein